MKSPSQHHGSVSTVQVAKQTQDDALRAIRTQAVKADLSPESRAQETRDPDALAALLFDRALKCAEITSAEVAFLLKVSESLVRRMRNPNARERVSFAQMLRLPPAFHIALQKEMNREYGFGRAALVRLLDAAGDLAVVGLD